MASINAQRVDEYSHYHVAERVRCNYVTDRTEGSLQMLLKLNAPGNIKTRPPVVTIMGHWPW